MAKTQPSYANLPYWLADKSLALPMCEKINETYSNQYDVAIVGAGFTGLSAAITLARAGRKVVMFEAGELGQGASCRNGGMLGPSFSKLGVDGLEKQYGIDQVYATIRESLHAFHWLVDFIKDEKIDCDLDMCGRFRGASHPSHYAGLVEQAEAISRLVDFPAIEVPPSQQHEETGSNAYYGGIVYPTDASLNPAKLFKGLLNIAIKEGVSIHQQSPVKKIEKDAGHFTVFGADQAYRAKDVIIATNGYTQGQFGKFKRRIIPIRSAMIATEALPESVIRSVSPKLRCHGGTERVVAYYRPSPDGRRILFGGRASGWGDQPKLYSKYLQDFMLRLFPHLADVRIDYAWSGLVAYTFDHVPHIGTMDGMHYAMGYCGSGVGRSNYFGRKVAQKVLNLTDGKTSFDDFPFNSRPLYTGTPWFLPAIMKWHSFADRQGW